MGVMNLMTALLLTASLAFSGEEVQRRLDAKISLELRGVKLSDAIQQFRDATGLNFVVAEGGDTEITLVVRDLSVRSVLRLMLQPRHLTARFEQGAVVIRDRSSERASTVLRAYDVRSIVMSIPDFPGSDLAEGPSWCVLLVPTVETQPAVVNEDVLAALIRTHTGGRSWDEGPHASLSARNGLLFVRQTPAVHREIESLLRKLGN